MANWYGAARSNYVKIKDMEGLVKALEPFSIGIHEGYGDNKDKFCFLSEEQDSGGWPSLIYIPETEDNEDGELEFDAETMICPFMEDGQILVMMEAGAEKLRYVTGNAVAYNSAGEFCKINIDDIYAKAAEAFKVPRESITEAEY